jgi:hypothetical protein
MITTLTGLRSRQAAKSAIMVAPSVSGPQIWSKVLPRTLSVVRPIMPHHSASQAAKRNGGAGRRANVACFIAPHRAAAHSPSPRGAVALARSASNQHAIMNEGQKLFLL